MSPLRVHGLDRFVDEVHAQFDAWATDDAIVHTIGPDGLEMLRLAVHEWVANLVQHAQFCGPAELVIALEVIEGGIRCRIEDSSQGFDFIQQVGAQKSVLDAPAPSERGRGLLMLVSCAEDLDFRQADEDHPQQIAFTVSAPTGDVFADLFRPEDLAFDIMEDIVLPDDIEDRGDGASENRVPVPSRPDPFSR